MTSVGTARAASRSFRPWRCLEAKFERRRIELGMTVEQFEAHMDAQTKATVRAEPLSEVELRGLQRKVAEFAEEWEPACEHDTENPWT